MSVHKIASTRHHMSLLLAKPMLRFNMSQVLVTLLKLLHSFSLSLQYVDITVLSCDAFWGIICTAIRFLSMAWTLTILMIIYSIILPCFFGFFGRWRTCLHWCDLRFAITFLWFGFFSECWEGWKHRVGKLLVTSHHTVFINSNTHILLRHKALWINTLNEVNERKVHPISPVLSKQVLHKRVSMYVLGAIHWKLHFSQEVKDFVLHESTSQQHQ